MLAGAPIKITNRPTIIELPSDIRLTDKPNYGEIRLVGQILKTPFRGNVHVGLTDSQVVFKIGRLVDT